MYECSIPLTHICAATVSIFDVTKNHLYMRLLKVCIDINKNEKNSQAHYH